MENQRIICKIKAPFIIKNIFKYIKDNNFYLKLLIYSKFFQDKLNIKVDYKAKYLEKIGFYIHDYLYLKQEKYKKNFLINKYNNFILDKNLNKEEFEDIICDVLENKYAININEDNLIKEYSEILINIDSPFFDIISKSKNFEKYTIYISEKNIDDYHLKDDYKRAYEKLNKLDRKYPSAFYSFNNKEKINYLKEFKIDFNKIKRMTLVQEEENNNKYYNNKTFFETLFSFNIESNLIYLKLKFIYTKENELDSTLFEKINNFKSLRYLYIDSLFFNKDIIIKPKNLRALSFKNSKNINISSFIFCEKIEILNLERNEISKLHSLENINFQELQKLNLYHNNISDIKELISAHFLNLKILDLSENKISNKIIILEKVNFKELKELNLSDNNISDIKVLEKVKFN